MLFRSGAVFGLTACVLVICAGIASAEASGIAYKGKNGIFTLADKRSNRLTFSLAVGYLNPEGGCSESEIDCEIIEGTATGSNGSYRYEYPYDPESGFTITLSGNAVIISNAHGSLGTGSGNGDLVDKMGGRYVH